MASLEEIRKARLEKLTTLQKRGLNPYPISTNRDFSLSEVEADFPNLSKKKSVTIAGRVMALRGQGGLVFADVSDGTGRFQILLKKDEMKEEAFPLWSESVDIGDFIEASGALFVTKRSEKTLAVASWRMLAKSLRPLPEKWHGLTDTEERFRRRYLDILMNEEVRARFIMRSRIVSALRAALEAEGFLEVETSMLQSLAGGTNAEPFKTHHNALDIDLFLRIAPELDLKKLLIAGYPKVYEIGRSFRNEGIDVTHNPEFTTAEWYEAYSDAAKQLALVENIFRGVVKKVSGSTSFIFDGKEIDCAKPFAVISYQEALKPFVSGSLSAKEKDSLFKKEVRPRLIQPTFVVEYPKEMLPLAKGMEGDEKTVDAFQFYVGGLELVKAFSELNDPIEQGRRFMREDEHKKAGDKEAQPNDREFVEALEYGCPPAGGVGIGIERLVMLLTNTKNIREVIFFPTLRPK